jgi:hypothetical protein
LLRRAFRIVHVVHSGVESQSSAHMHATASFGQASLDYNGGSIADLSKDHA